MRRHLTNAGYGVLDYVSYPAGMLLVAPIVLHKLGAAEYGLWMIATSVISAGGIVASGFCDACIQRIAYLRGAGKLDAAPRAIRTMLAINIAFGCLLALGVWTAAPFAALHVAVSRLTPPAECLISFRIASVAILVRAIESLAVGVQRAFEQYRDTVRISTAMRLLTLGCAAVLALLGMRTVSILVAATLFLVLCALAQFRELCRLTGYSSFWPRFYAGETRILLGQGFFVWLQALGGVAFGQLDRILLGVYLGDLAVTPYSLCVQFANPIYGLNASGLSFLFPYFSARAGANSRTGLNRVLRKALACNLILVAMGAGLLLAVGDRLIVIWAGAAVAQSAAGILPPIVLGSALMGLSVTGTYALQALGKFRTVACISLAGRAAMLLLMLDLLRRHGLEGMAISRLGFGSVALLVYLPLLRQLSVTKRERVSTSALTMPIEAQEASKP